MKRIKILHLIPTLEGGGAERQLAMLAAEHSRRNFDIHVAVRRVGVNKSIINDSDVALHFLGDYPGLNPLLISRVSQVINKLRPDIVQSWLTQMDIVAGALKALKAEWPWIMTERNSKLAYADASLSNYLRLRLALYSNTIVANSQYGADYWLKKLGQVKTVNYIPNCIDVSAIREARQLRSIVPNGNTDLIYLFVGRFVDAKAPNIVFSAFRNLIKSIKAKLIMLGEGPLRDNLINEATRLGLNEYIIILPYDSNWWALLSNSTALVSASRYEGQPNVLLEAAIGGCPIIATDIPAHREILDEKSALFFPVDGIETLTERMLQVAFDQDKSCNRTRNAYERHKNKSVSNIADLYSQIYFQLVS